MKIPIQNLYYLLSYAWDRLEESRLVPVAADDYVHLQDLLAKVLTNGCQYLIKKGLDRDYLEVEDAYPGIKGRLEFSESLRRNSFRSGRAVCRFDEFSPNIVQNRILKSVIRRLLRTRQLDERLIDPLWQVYWHFDGVEELSLDQPVFRQVRIHRNNQFYGFLIQVCRFIVENTVLDEKEGDYQFRDFLRDQRQMAYLFEEFVRNFYRREVPAAQVGRENIQWAANAVGTSDLSMLPLMQTDISLLFPDRKLIIDTKYYQETLSGYFESEKVRSGNLYQLFAYVKNLATASQADHLDRHCAGLLLYPTVQQEVDQAYRMGDHLIRIATVKLDQDWRAIEERLLQLVR